MAGVYERLEELYPFLAKLKPPVRQRLMEGLSVREHADGEELLSETRSCPGFSFILEGCVRVYRMHESGREVTLYRLHEGDSCFVTVSSLLYDQKLTTYAEAEGDVTIALVPLDVFTEHILNDVHFLRFIFGRLYRAFETVIDRLDGVLFNSIEARILEYLRAGSRAQRGKNRVLYVTHQRIAVDIGSSREVVSRALKSLERQGKLQLSRGKIRLLAEA